MIDIFKNRKLKAKIEALKTDIKDHKDTIEYLRNLIALRDKDIECKGDKIIELEENVKNLKKTVFNLERERDFLYQYYNLDEEPSQEVKTQVRIDKRVRELELENIELKARLQGVCESRINYLNRENKELLRGMLYLSNVNVQYPNVSFPNLSQWR